MEYDVIIKSKYLRHESIIILKKITEFLESLSTVDSLSIYVNNNIRIKKPYSFGRGYGCHIINDFKDVKNAKIIYAAAAFHLIISYSCDELILKTNNLNHQTVNTIVEIIERNLESIQNINAIISSGIFLIVLSIILTSFGINILLSISLSFITSYFYMIVLKRIIRITKIINPSRTLP